LVRQAVGTAPALSSSNIRGRLLPAERLDFELPYRPSTFRIGSQPVPIERLIRLGETAIPVFEAPQLLTAPRVEREYKMLRRLDNWLRPSDQVASLVDPAFRVLTSLIFIVGGLGHFRQHEVMLKRIGESPWREFVRGIGDPSLLLWLSGAAFVVCGATLAIGWMTRISALVLFATLVPVTIAIHVVPDTSHIGPLFKNVAILGALLYFWARGPGAHALDGQTG